MGAIFRVDENDLPWAGYKDSDSADGPVQIRYKALTLNTAGVPPVQYVEYARGHADAVHSHKTGEVLVVTDGELWLDDAKSGPGSVVFIPADTEYSVRGGDEGVRFFRIVIP